MTTLESLLVVLPELILTLGATDLLLVAAFSKKVDKARRVSIYAVLMLVACGLALLGPAGDGGAVFGGLYVADAFSTFESRVRFFTFTFDGRPRITTVTLPLKSPRRLT